ncbi:MAG: hypothetical protein KBT27_14100, partial [Prevotellaceae bacterium]|nr:hypothetical protein [Candidatus Faecinaster equi]
MVAATENKEDNFLQFKNLCGYVVVKLYGEGTVTSIKLEGNDGEKISGKADVQAAFGTLPSVTMSEEATTSITLDCGDGVALGTTAETATEFWLCVPPVTFSKGFTVTATKTDGWQMIKSTSSSKEVVRNTMNAMTPIEAVFDKEPDNSQALALEREALIAIYNALDGDNWPYHHNWCTNEPIKNWDGVSTNEQGNVIGLDLYQSSPLFGCIPKEIGNLSHLSNFTICLNTNDPLPEEMNQLKELERFRIYNMGNENKQEFPDGLYECSNLKELELSGRFNVKLSPKIKQLAKLRKLDLYPDSFTGLPDEIGELKDLEKLSIQLPNNTGCIGEIPSSIGNLRKLSYLFLRNFKGSIPSEIGNLQNLETLWFYSNFPVKSIPEEIYSLRMLKSLTLSFSMLPYCIPDAIGNLTNLEYLEINYSLTGRIPESIGNLTNLKRMDLSNPFPGDPGESLTGPIPLSLQKLEFWPYFWPDVILGHPYLDVRNFMPPAPNIKAHDLLGEVIDTDESYHNNKLTIIHHFDDICPNVEELLQILKEAYVKYADKGLEIIGYNDNYYDEYIWGLVNKLEIPWKVYNCNRYPLPNGNQKLGCAAGLAIVIDSSRQVVCNNLTGSNTKIGDFIERTFSSDTDGYVSTDFSKDGQVTKLQASSLGSKNNLIIVGDGFSDRQIDDGTYYSAVNKTMEAFFSEEPYKSFRDKFNVYRVTAVSKSEGYDNGSSTAIGGWFGENTQVGGIDGNAIGYALLAVDDSVLDDAVIIVVMNKDLYAGTCYMYWPSSEDYGRGLAIAYFPTSSDTDTFNGLVSHEAGGHGFAKLGDEYAYEYMG